MVLFKYLRDNNTISSNGDFANPTRILLESDAESMDQLLEDFKAFALSLGYHSSTVSRIQIVEPEEQSEGSSEELGYGDKY